MDSIQKLGSLRDGINKEVSTQLILSLNTIFPRKDDSDDFNLLELEERPKTAVTLSDEQAQRLATLCGGQYTYDNEFASGGEGLILRVRNTWTGRREIIKIANNVIRDRKKSTARFLRGAKIQSFVRSKTLFGVPETFSINWDFVFYTMEYIAGETLLTFLAKCVDEKLLMMIFVKILDLIAEIHRRKIIHRDIKPQNFKITKHPITGQLEPVLLDWSLSKNVENQSEGLTGIGTELGTPAYVSQEQWDDAANATFSDDIFACGRLFYVFLTYKALGKLPVDKKDYYPHKYLSGSWLKIYMIACGAKDIRYPTTTSMSNAIRKELGLPLISETNIVEVDSKIYEIELPNSNVNQVAQQKVGEDSIKILGNDSSKINIDLEKITDDAVKKFLIAVDTLKKAKIKK